MPDPAALRRLAWNVLTALLALAADLAGSIAGSPRDPDDAGA